MEIKKILIAYLQNKISPKQKEILGNWIHSKKENEELFQNLNNEEFVNSAITNFSKFNPKEDWKKVQGKLNKNKKNYFVNAFKYAAAIVIIISSVWVFINVPNNTHQPKIKITKQISYGKNKAILTLHTGENINLENIKDSTIQHKNTILKIRENNSLIVNQKNAKGKHKQPKWNKIWVPRGGEYYTQLSDGTKIWLNSETELRFPTSFTASKREIYIRGEAYLEVAKNQQKPFIVKTHKMNVKVLGTQFNIMAYPNDSKIHTTLVEGSVQVRSKVSDKKIILKPGQQALLKNNKLKAQNVNTKIYTSWKNDRFAFKSEALKHVVLKLERWYDVEFEFQNKSLESRKFSGNIPKYKDIKIILELLEFTTNLKFTIKNNCIKIDKK